MSKSGAKKPTSPKASRPSAKKATKTLRPSMKANEKLIGRAILGSGAPQDDRKHR